MATTGGNGGPAPSASAPQGQAQLSVLGQYIKDFSFENPNAPRSLAPNQTQPAINIQINVSAQQLAQTDYEISLKLEGKAESAGTISRSSTPFAASSTTSLILRKRPRTKKRAR